ncbi:MAG TPA: ankyrin repeat domain-containing protein [Marinagarivorans sp.]
MFKIFPPKRYRQRCALRTITFAFLFAASAASQADCEYAELISAIKAGNAEGVASYLSQDCSASAPSPTSISALELSLILNKTGIFKQLVKADESLVETHGVNALAAACNINVKNKEAIEMLTAKGVDINTMSANGFSCLYNAAVVPDLEFFNYLITLGANPNAQIVPDPMYKIDHLISVKAFIKRRAEAYQQLDQAVTEAANNK